MEGAFGFLAGALAVIVGGLVLFLYLQSRAASRITNPNMRQAWVRDCFPDIDEGLAQWFAIDATPAQLGSLYGSLKAWEQIPPDDWKQAFQSLRATDATVPPGVHTWIARLPDQERSDVIFMLSKI